MPIYEYRRPDGSTFEVVQAFSDEPLSVDPDTGVPVERVLHAPAVHFKGTGFYNTDYGTRKRNRETVAAAEGSPSDKDSATASSGTDSKTARSGESAGATKTGSDGSAGASAPGKDAGASKKGSSAKGAKTPRAR